MSSNPFLNSGSEDWEADLKTPKMKKAISGINRGFIVCRFRIEGSHNALYGI